MKSILFITSVLAIAFVTGCKPAEKPKVQGTGGAPAAQQLDKAQTVADEAARQMKDYSFAQKTEFVAAMKLQLAELNRSIEELDATIAKSNAAVKTEAAPKLAALREQAAKLDLQLAAVVAADQSTWNGIKADAEKAYAALKEGVTQSRQWISDKIAP
jgi:hypothetical protein